MSGPGADAVRELLARLDGDLKAELRAVDAEAPEAVEMRRETALNRADRPRRLR